MLRSFCNSLRIMDAKARVGAIPDASPQKRTKSSVLKSIIPGNHKRHPSSKTDSKHHWNDDSDDKEDYMYLSNRSILPPDHPHTRGHLVEESGNKSTTSAIPKKPIDAQKEHRLASEQTQRMTRSASFKSIMGKGKDKPPKKERQMEVENKMKKSKSSTSISAILSRPRSSKGAKAEEAHGQKNKENQTPPSSAGIEPPPIWAQFATHGFEEPARNTKIPLNDQSAVEEEVVLYTPRDYSPSKQRNFQHYQQPTLSRRAEPKPRPKSDYIAPCPTSASFAEALSGLRKSGRDKSHADISNQHEQTRQAADSSRKSFAENDSRGFDSSVENQKVSNDSAGSDLPMPKRGSRVMAVVAAFNGKAKEVPKEPPKDTEIVHLDPKAIESAFESLLVS